MTAKLTTTLYVPRPPDAPPIAPVKGEIYYPDSDGEPMAESGAQAESMHYAFGALNEWFRDRTDVYIAIDMFLYHVEGDPLSVVAPDLYIMFGVIGRHLRASWQVWNENGILPSIVIEFASRSTWREDAGRKRDLYAALGVSHYWRYDATAEFLTPVLIGERLVNGKYEPIPLTSDGSAILRGYCEPLGLDVCVIENGELRFYDPVGREWLLSHEESEAARRESEAGRLVAEAALQQSEAARREAESEILRLRELLAQQSPSDERR